VEASEGAVVKQAVATPAPTVLELFDGRKINLGLLEPGLQDSLCDFLQAVGPGARASQTTPRLNSTLAGEARSLMPVLKRQSARLIAEVEGIKGFQEGLKSAIRRAWVTPALALTCVTVFVAMVLCGVSATKPSVEALLAWGANFGPYVAFDREYWRLFTSMFLHGEFLHLFFNMWCLLAAGPLIERLFGHVGFAVLYILSGLGGALASMAMHPQVVGVGASGAIFGIFGALVGFLVAQHQTVPTTLLKPLRASALSFIAYNIFFGMTSEQVDNSAHLGGLATGFLCGLLLHRRLPIDSDHRGIVRRLVATVGLSLALVLAAWAVSDTVGGDQALRAASHVNHDLASLYNELARELEKPTESYYRTYQEMNTLLDRLNQTDRVGPGDPAVVERLASRAETDLATLRRASSSHPDLQAMLVAVATSIQELRDALKLLHKALGENDPERGATIRSFQEKLSASDRSAEEFLSRRDKFLSDHGFMVETSVGDASGGGGQ
jgi:rhomboid protease GluP